MENLYNSICSYLNNDFFTFLYENYLNHIILDK